MSRAYEVDVDGRHRVPAEAAATGQTRWKGLLGRDGLDGALWIEPCRQVHTFRMRFAIDVAYVDRQGAVLAVRTLPPGRLGPWRRRARAVVEASAGALATWGVEPGSTLTLRAPQERPEEMLDAGPGVRRRVAPTRRR